MSVNVLYRAAAIATGGRDGRARTLDGSFDVALATPRELGGAGGPGNNPEQLFAAGYSACFLGAMKFVASQGGPQVPADAAVTATVGIGPRAAGGFGLDVASPSPCPASRGWRPRHWSRRPIRSAPTRTQSAAMSRSSSRWPERLSVAGLAIVQNATARAEPPPSRLPVPVPLAGSHFGRFWS
jgi:osmotically inducible protein OsmC